MAIYHLEAKIISRGSGRSACAAAAYMSCSKILNDYDGIEHDYTRKRGLVWEKVFLPENAPAEWQNRSVLWNAVEEEEKAKDNRLAREFVVALPIELGKDEWKVILSEFIEQQFVDDGMCADVAVHDTGTGNPHAHIMLTVRPLDENGKWQYKTEKEYLCIRIGEERGFTAAEFKTAQTEGWEKQYPYKVGKKKIYMAPSEAETHGYERADKHPKSTKFGRQNPITARWNSEEQLVRWRAAWAECVNKNLEQCGLDERIDHRSFADRGIDEQPTIHEGVIARAMEAKGIISDRCELNRKIKEDNRMLRTLKAEIQRLTDSIKHTIPALAEALENLRKLLIILIYKFISNKKSIVVLKKEIDAIKPDLDHYRQFAAEIKTKLHEMKALETELADTSILHVADRIRLSKRISELSEDIEELRSSRNMLLTRMECPNAKAIQELEKNISAKESNIQKLTEENTKFNAEMNTTLRQIEKLSSETIDVDQEELLAARLAIRPDFEHDVVSCIRTSNGEKIDQQNLHRSHERVAELLHEKKLSLVKQLRASNIINSKDDNVQHRQQTEQITWQSK